MNRSTGARVTSVLAFVLAAAVSPGGRVAADDAFPGRLYRLTQPGPATVTAGGLVEIALPSNPTTGPNNPAANLKVEVRGATALKSVGVFFAPPARVIPGAPGEIRAYFTTTGEGRSTVVVTPISGRGEAGQPLSFAIDVVR